MSGAGLEQCVQLLMPVGYVQWVVSDAPVELAGEQGEEEFHGRLVVGLAPVVVGGPARVEQCVEVFQGPRLVVKLRVGPRG